ncbi:GntR family transcriptional regulator [Pseudothermotoga sp.]
MWFKVDFTSHVPVYKQIKEKLKLLILTGELKPGDFVPSIRTLADDLRVNVNTVARAYRELAMEGVLEPVRGEGYLVRQLNGENFMRSSIENFIDAVERCKVVGIGIERLVSLLKEIYGRRDDGSEREELGEEL